MKLNNIKGYVFKSVDDSICTPNWDSTERFIWQSARLHIISTLRNSMINRYISVDEHVSGFVFDSVRKLHEAK